MSKFIKISGSYFRKSTITNVGFDYSSKLEGCNHKTVFSLVITQEVGSNRVITYTGIGDNVNPSDVVKEIIDELETI